jgi:hypothetical protein
MIHKLEGNRGWVISSHQCWLPGVYDSERTARYAFRFNDSTLSALQQQRGDRLITMDDLRAARKSQKAKTT